MPNTYTRVRLTDVLDPLAATRSDVTFDVPGPVSTDSVVDGSELWSLPGLYDADAHLPLQQFGIRESDRWRALAGGVTSMNTALPWHVVAPLDLDTVTARFASTTFPRILPILTIADEPSSAGFAAWLADAGEQIRTTWMPVIKIYSNDPNFWPNLDAIWSAGCRAAIYFYDHESYEKVLATSGPVHFRHVISKAMADEISDRADSTCQTSPHFLIELAPDRPAGLHVLPPVPGGQARTSLLEVVGERVEVIASDHNAPVPGNTGPGLEIQQYLLPSLLTLAEQGVLDLATAITMATTAPTEVFAPAASLSQARVVVDPRPTGPVGLWPGQEARRAAFLGVPLSGSTVAVVDDGFGFFL